MDKYKKIQIFCWSIVIIVCVGMAIWLLTRVNFPNIGYIYNSANIIPASGPYEKMGSYTVNSDDIDRLNIDWIAGGVTITPYEGNVIELTEYAQRELDEDEIVDFNTVGDKLEINFYARKGRGIKTLPPKRIEVKIPVSLAENMEDLTVDNVSATANISGIIGDKIYVDSVSGEIILSELEAESLTSNSTSGKIGWRNLKTSKANIDTTSGDISINDLVIGELRIDTTSGNAEMIKVTADSLDFDSISGDYTYHGTFKNLSADSTSGNFKITDLKIPESFQFYTTSGDVYLTLPVIENFKVYHDSTSGDLDSEIPIWQGKSNQYRFDTTSGDVEIYELK